MSSKSSARTNVRRSTIKRFARRSGIRVVGSSTYDATRKVIEEFLRKILRDALEIMIISRRKKLTHEDVVRALEARGIRLTPGKKPTKRC